METIRLQELKYIGGKGKNAADHARGLSVRGVWVGVDPAKDEGRASNAVSKEGVQGEELE